MKRARDFGLVCGSLPPGPLNAITDVPGVRVGHRTLVDGDVRTGFTALVPHEGDLFREKLPAAVEVINGFGKSCGSFRWRNWASLRRPSCLATRSPSAPASKRWCAGRWLPIPTSGARPAP